MDQPITPTRPVFTQTPVEPELPKRSYTWLIVIIIIFLLAGSSVLAFKYFQLKQQAAQTRPSPLPAATPVPSADPTANWKTYTNPSLKYLLKYPQSWEIQEYPDADLPYVLHRLELRNNNKPQLVIETYKELLVKTVPEDEVVRSEQITISGVTGTKNWHNPFGPPAEIIIIFDTKTYRILLQDANQNQTADQILSTFKFTHESSEGQFCGGFAGAVCPEGYSCKYDGSYPDASGKCIKK